VSLAARVSLLTWGAVVLLTATAAVLHFRRSRG
jgi:hypothetical protein